MKLHTDGANEVERSNVASETTFRIKTTAKAFDILSSGLYTDPRLAIVRELSCNAYDAHVAAGKIDVPFEIHLPNSLEPWFHVKDYGTGLSDKDVMSLYTTYFESTKADSNDFIGALGLGSKSPFSYTKAFEVISRHNGKRRTYSVFINEDGIPSIARLGEIDTDENNGLEVRITIKPGDFYAFMEKTRSALRWFPVKPIVSGYPGFKFLDVAKEHLTGNGWKMFDSNFASDYSKMTAVQGNVAYKVDIGQLGLDQTTARMLNHSHVVGFFTIGDLEVAANREEIRYDDRSKKALVAKLTEVRAGVLASIEAQVDALKGKSFWDIVLELNIISKKIFNDKMMFKIFTQDSKHKDILAYRKIDGEFKIDGLLKGYELTSFEQTSNGSTRRRIVGNGITPEPQIVLFYNDLPKGGISRIQQWVRDQKHDYHHPPTAIIIRQVNEMADTTVDPTDSKKIISTRPWTQADYDKDLKNFVDAIGNPKILVASNDTPVPVRVKGEYVAQLPMFNYGSIKGRYKRYIDWKRNPEKDLSEGGLYFPLQNGSHIMVTGADGQLQQINWNMESVESYLRQGVELINDHLDTEYKMSDLFGVGSQAIGKIKKNVKWINFFDALKSIIGEYKDPVNHWSRLDATPDDLGIRSIIRTHPSGGFTKKVEELADTSVFKQTLMPMIKSHRNFFKFQGKISLIKRIDVDFGTKMFDNTAVPYYTSKPFSDYPMFSFVENIEYHTGSKLDALFDYIKLIDRS